MIIITRFYSTSSEPDYSDDPDQAIPTESVITT